MRVDQDAAPLGTVAIASPTQAWSAVRLSSYAAAALSVVGAMGGSTSDRASRTRSTARRHSDISNQMCGRMAEELGGSRNSDSGTNRFTGEGRARAAHLTTGRPLPSRLMPT